MLTKVIWINHNGQRMEHTLGCKCTYAYAADWFRRTIQECQGILSQDRRKSKLKLLEIKNCIPNDYPLNVVTHTQQLGKLKDLPACSTCGGTGQDDPPPGKYHGICTVCNGTGKKIEK